MKYSDLLEKNEEKKITKWKNITEKNKQHILDNLDTQIDDRFSGFKHIIIPTLRNQKNYEDLEKINYLDPFFVDQNKIINSKSFRRLGDKAQVLPNVKEESSHMRNRMTHSLEVSELSELFCLMMNHKFEINKIPIRLNTEACKAIALGHDIGHTPFWHIGERYLTEKSKKDFEHNIFSTVVAEKIERKWNGLNLLNETKTWILNHSTNWWILDLKGHPQEYAVVRIMDKIAYVLSDFNDWIRQWYINGNIIPLFNKLWKDHRERILKIIETLVEESFKNWYITFWESKIGKLFVDLRKKLFNEYYKKVDTERTDIAYQKLDIVYDFFKRERPDIDPIISIALLTDVEAIKISKILKNTPNISYQDLIKDYHLWVTEILPYIAGRDIDRNNSTEKRNTKEVDIKKQIEDEVTQEIKEALEKKEIIKPKRERRFLIKKIENNLNKYESSDIIEAYLSIGKNNELKIKKTTKSDGTERYTRIIKYERGVGISEEKETEISQKKFYYLLHFANDKILAKRRHFIPIENWLTIKLDISTKYKPIVKIEFPDDESMKNFTPPTWFDKEVTHKKSYKGSQKALKNSIKKK